MISSNLKQEIKADLHRIYPGGFSYKKLFLAFLRTKGFKYLLMLRLKSHPNPLISLPAGFIKRILGYRYGFQIPSEIKIGKGFFIGHFGTIVVSIYASFGNNCNIAHNCTIGSSGVNKQKKAPQIKDRVWIGTGAVLVGDISVGPDVVIAPNAFVNFDVPPHSLVIGNPGKAISKQNLAQKYINNAWVG